MKILSICLLFALWAVGMFASLVLALQARPPRRQGFLPRRRPFVLKMPYLMDLWFRITASRRHRIFYVTPKHLYLSPLAHATHGAVQAPYEMDVAMRIYKRFQTIGRARAWAEAIAFLCFPWMRLGHMLLAIREWQLLFAPENGMENAQYRRSMASTYWMDVLRTDYGVRMTRQELYDLLRTEA